MKKVIFMSLAVLVCGAAIIACAPEKKSKVGGGVDAITVEVTPNVIGKIDNAAPEVTLTAIVKNKDVVQSNAVVKWIVYPSTDYGKCTPATSSSTVFKANVAKTISEGAYIIAEYNGIKSDPVIYSINKAPIIIDSVAITGNPSNLDNNNTVSLTATAYSDVTPSTTALISWSVSPANLGTITGSPSKSGSAVTFKASASESGTATITAKYNNTTVQKSVNIVIGNTATPNFYIYSDNNVLPNVEPMFFGDWQWWDSRGPSYYSYSKSKSQHPPETSSFAMPEVFGVGAPGDTAKSYHMSLTGGTDFPGNYYGGVNLHYNGGTIDGLTTYSKIHFWAKADVACNVEIKICGYGNPDNPTFVKIIASENIPVGGKEFVFDNLTIPAGIFDIFVMTVKKEAPVNSPSPVNIWLDDIYFSK